MVNENSTARQLKIKYTKVMSQQWMPSAEVSNRLVISSKHKLNHLSLPFYYKSMPLHNTPLYLHIDYVRVLIPFVRTTQLDWFV